MWVLGLINLSSAFYLPGVAPYDYKINENIDLYVEKLDSYNTQIPYEYYYLNFCGSEAARQQKENIGQELMGDLIESSPYTIQMQNATICMKLCSKSNTPRQLKDFRYTIDYNYRASWVLDTLPAGFRTTSFASNERRSIYQDGFPIGFKQDSKYYINNHHIINIQVYYTGSSEAPTWRVVGFLVEPLSINNTQTFGCLNKPFKDTYFNNKTYEEILPQAEIDSNPDIITYVPELEKQVLQENITYTYSVVFENSTTPWASRWDHYFYMSANYREVHWLGLVNSFAMVLLLSGMVGSVLRRAIKKDITSYNDSSEFDDETGWKQIRSDVFRSPSYASLFSITIGTGVQVILMTVLTLFFTTLGFLSPEHRGGLLTTVVVLFVFMGIFAGYTSARLFKMFGGIEWKRNALGTSVMFPGLCFGMFFFINLFLVNEKSSRAVSFSILIQLLLLWFGISMPLVFLGSFIGYTKQPIENPSKVSKIPKPIQIVPGTNKIKFVSYLAGCLPFGCMFIELSYVMNSLWHHTLFYYLFGFLFLCFIVLVITSAEVAILISYLVLCREDYRWWWLSFTVPAYSGLYFFVYTVFYWFLKLEVMKISSIVLYFGYMVLGAVSYSLITGTIGFFASFIFIRTIFSLIKLE